MRRMPGDCPGSRAAYREAWNLDSEAFREARAARSRLIGGTEEYVIRAEEAFARVGPRLTRGIGAAVRRMLLHRSRTGHWLRVRRPEGPPRC